MFNDSSEFQTNIEYEQEDRLKLSPTRIKLTYLIYPPLA